MPNKIKIQTSKLRFATFEKGKNMSTLNFDYNEGPMQVVDLSLIIRSRQNTLAIKEPKKAYTRRNPISKAKFFHLKKMCDKGIIPEQFVAEYLNLPYDGSVRDALPETDDEEDRDDYVE